MVHGIQLHNLHNTRNKSVSIISLNIRSIINPTHFIQLKDLLVHGDIDICCVQETFATPEYKMLEIPNYKILRCDRPTHGGGVAIIHKTEHICKVLLHTDFNSHNEIRHQTEYLFISSKIGNRKPLLILNVYRPPYSVNIKSFQKLLKSIIHVIEPNQRCFVIGDFNLNLLQRNTFFDLSSNIQNYYEIMLNMGFNQLIQVPTRSNNLIDHIWTNNLSDISATVFEPHISDHKAIQLTINLKKEKLKKQSYTYRDYKNLNIELFIYNMSNLNLLDTVSDNPMNSWTNWMNRVTPELNTLIPEKTKAITIYRNKKYLSHETMALKRSRDLAYKIYSKDRSDDNKVTVNNLNKQVNKAIRHDTKHHINNLIEKNGFWNGISNLVQLKSSKKEDCLSLDNETIESLNTFYAEIGIPLRDVNEEEEKILIEKGKWTSFFRPHTITSCQLKEAWKVMKNKGKKTEDIMGFSLLMITLLMCVPNVENSIVTLFNQFITTCQTPAIFKTSIITPLIKDNRKPPHDFNNLRPIYIIPGLARLYEKIVHKQLSDYLEVTNYFSKYQFGFRKGHSTEHTVLAIADVALKALENKKICVLVTLDLKKAFNSVSRKLLLVKLVKAGVDPTWFSNYLEGRYQQVKNNNILSRQCRDSYGIPQGTVLGPILFSIFINDFPEILRHCTTFLFADDSSLLITGYPHELPTLIQKIEEDIERALNWMAVNSLQINAEKTECLVIGSPTQLNQVGQITIEVNSCKIKSSENVKILGCIIDSKLTWLNHIKKMENKFYINLKPLYSLRPLLTQDNILILVNSLALSHVNYMSCLWGTAKKQNLKKVEKIIRTAARLVLGLRKYDSVKLEISTVLKWLLPAYSYQYSILCYMYQLINYNFAPLYFSEQMVTNNQIHQHQTRSGNLLQVSFPKTYYGSRIFTHNAFSLWNSMPDTEKHVSYKAFKKIIKHRLLNEQSSI